MARTFTIASETVLVSPNWSISEKVNARATASLNVIDLGNLTEINVGDSISIVAGSDTIFAGIIRKVVEEETSPNFLTYSITCQDNSALADKRLVAETGTNETAGYIVQNVILPYLTDEGVTAGTIETGITVKKYTFNYIKASQCLDQIKTISGLNWNIDKDKKLNLFSNSANVSPWTLDSTVQHNRFKREKNLDNYRNVQYVRAGKGRTNTLTDEQPSPKPDGVSRTFTMKFPIAEKPTIKINSVAVSASDVGVKGLDTGKKYYFTYNSNTIYQDDAETVLSATDTLEVTYIGLYDILVQTENTTQIAERASAESGTSGRYEHLSEEKSITETDEAQQYGEGLLDKYSEVLDRITFNTSVSGLEAGQLLDVNKTLYNINDSFLIESLKIRALTQNTLQYSIVALDGASIGGWEEYFKEILRIQKTYVINENEKLEKIQKFVDSLVLGESLTFPTDEELSDSITITDSLTPTDAGVESRVGYALVGYSEVG